MFVSSLNNVNVSSTTPVDQEALSYDSDYLSTRAVTTISPTGPTVVSGNKIYEGGIRFDAAGDLIRELRFQNVIFGTVSATTSTSRNVTFSPQAFNSIPRVYVTVQGSEAGSRRLTAVVNQLTTSGCTVWVYNASSSEYTVVVKMLLIEVV